MPSYVVASCAICQSKAQEMKPTPVGIDRSVKSASGNDAQSRSGASAAGVSQDTKPVSVVQPRVDPNRGETRFETAFGGLI